MSSVSSLSFLFLLLPCPFLSFPLLSLFSLSLGDDTKWPTRVDMSLNLNTINKNPSVDDSETCLLRNQSRNIITILHMDSCQFLNMSPQKWFQSVDSYGRQTTILEVAVSPLHITVSISLSHLHRDHWSDFFETYLGCSSCGLGVHAQIKFWSVVIWPPSVILDFSCYCYTSITSRDMHMDCSHSLDAQKWFQSIDLYGRYTAIIEIATFPFLNTVTIFFETTGQISSKLVWDIPLIV